MASAFLRARCAHGFYCTPSGGIHTRFETASWASDLSAPCLEENLAHACTGLLLGALSPRRRHLGGGGVNDDNENDALIITGALADVLNLLNALLVLLAGEAPQLPARSHSESLASALGEARATLAEGDMFCAIKRGRDWLDRAPKTLAAYLQFCVLWNTVGLQTVLDSHHGGRVFKRLEPSFDLLDRILSGTGSSLHYSGGGVAIWRSSASLVQTRVRRSVIYVLAARCIECVAPQRPFSRAQVLSFQLALQGVACDGDGTSAPAALAAVGALWEAYSGVLCSTDLFDQPWNEFTLECCFGSARWLLVNGSDEDSTARGGSGGGRGGGSKKDSSRFSRRTAARPGEAPYPDGVGGDPSILISAAAALTHCRYRLRRTANRTQPWLRSSLAWSSGHSGGSGGGGIAGVLSATATACAYECLALLAEDVCPVGILTNEDSPDQGQGAEETQDYVPDAGSGGVGGGDHDAAAAAAHCWGAIGQLVRMLLLTLPAEHQKASYVGNGERGKAEGGDGCVAAARQAAAEALSALHEAFPKSYPGEQFGSSKTNDGSRFGGGGTTPKSVLLSAGTYFEDCGGEAAGAARSYGGILVIKHELWQIVSQPCPAPSCSVLSLHSDHPAIVCVLSRSELKQLIDRLSPQSSSEPAPPGRAKPTSS